jgi:DNA-directed RNA polymerase subunit L
MSDLNSIIREMIKKELEEVSTSAGAGAFNTPNAFTGGKAAGEKRRKKIATQAGYTLAHKSGEDGEELTEARSRYLEFKSDPTATPKQKIGRAISEINRQLNELGRVVEMSAKLKTESNMESSGLWKRTGAHLSKMENKMLEISQRIRELKS